MQPPRKIRLFKPTVGEEELANIREVFERAWLGLGPTVDRFENEWARYIGTPHAVGLNSATAALHAALAVKRFEPGKKVLVPAITFISTAHSVLYSGLDPVFVDVDPHTLTIDVEDMRRKITPDTVAVIPVHVGGQPAQMEHLMPLAREHGLYVVEDCANCAGGSYRGRKLGTWGDVGCFSFEEKKTMTTGDGGMVNHADPELDARLRRFRWMGIDRDTWKRAQLGQDNMRPSARHWYYEVADLGYKYNMNDLAAAIGLAQLKKVDGMNARRAQLIARYIRGLEGSTLVRPTFPYELEGSAFWLMSVRVSGGLRDDLIIHLQESGVATGVHFLPVPKHPLYHGYDTGFPHAEAAFGEILTLPLFPELSEEDVDHVVERIREFESKV